MPPGFTYILLCEDNHLYTGSTINLRQRIRDHIIGKGANFTKAHPPIGIVYLEKFSRISQAFKREKQIQKWRRAKKIALIKGDFARLQLLSKAYRDLDFIEMKV